MRFIDTTRSWAQRIKRDALTLWFARNHPATPWYAKALGAFVVAYALSPIDLIPDFIPVLGVLDEVILLPLLIWLAVKLLPPAALKESRAQAEEWLAESRAKPRSRLGGAVIVLLWLTCLLLAAGWLAAHLGR